MLQNANLVLTANREGRPKGKEPTGEPETLANRRLHKMGDRAAHTLPEELEELKKRKPKYSPLPAPDLDIMITHGHLQPASEHLCV